MTEREFDKKNLTLALDIDNGKANRDYLISLLVDHIHDLRERCGKLELDAGEDN